MGGMGCQICRDTPCTCAPRTFMQEAALGFFDDVEEAINDAVQEWHEAPVGLEVPLHQFLGMTDSEYRHRIEDPRALHAIIEERKKR